VLALTAPWLFVAVKVYVVVYVGITAKEPVLATDPTDGEMLSKSALLTFHDNVANWPDWT
jgi:hypothetical protein